MSVPKYKRRTSPTEFLKELYDMNVYCGQIMAKMPKKYRQNYGDFIIQQCLKALECAQKANAIYVSANTTEDMMQRRYQLFHETYEICTSIPTMALIFFELSKHVDGNNDRCTKAEIMFAEKCDNICKLIKGVMKSDKARYKEYKEQS